MKTEECELVMDLATKKLTEADFLSRFRGGLVGKKLCGQLMKESLQSKDPTEVECALIVGYTFGFLEEHLPALLELASAPWHFKHEDIVTALGRLKTPKAIETLYQATQWVPTYLDFDESRALAVKAIWALGNIDDPKADKALKNLTGNSDPILAREALRQIQRCHTAKLNKF